MFDVIKRRNGQSRNGRIPLTISLATIGLLGLQLALEVEVELPGGCQTTICPGCAK